MSPTDPNNWTGRHPGVGVVVTCGKEWRAVRLSPDGPSTTVRQVCVLESGHAVDGVYCTSAGKVQDR